jgi:hypothetical protein
LINILGQLLSSATALEMFVDISHVYWRFLLAHRKYRNSTLFGEYSEVFIYISYEKAYAQDSEK